MLVSWSSLLDSEGTLFGSGSKEGGLGNTYFPSCLFLYEKQCSRDILIKISPPFYFYLTPNTPYTRSKRYHVR